ncbi:hypothetical protein CEXT_728001 [Caerostris extrusa]|uniref:Uncharacterized protein n=1 Tax=Caerostris extrusa TaxID=172846 RepID=A0AAV4SUR4_CAEEX|nr:hypothetical protein CEXT_728001 [Caerostris extrusa]
MGGGGNRRPPWPSESLMFSIYSHLQIDEIFHTAEDTFPSYFVPDNSFLTSFLVLTKKEKRRKKALARKRSIWRRRPVYEMETPPPNEEEDSFRAYPRGGLKTHSSAKTKMV